MSDFIAVPARKPANEKGRMAAVLRTGLMGSDATARFDIHTKLFRSIEQVPVAYLGLIERRQEQLTLTASGTSLKTGRGLGPTQYKTKASAIRNSDLLDAMFGMIE